MSTTQSSLQALFAVLMLILLPAGTRGQTNFLEDTKTLYCYQCNSGIHKDCPFLQANNTNSIYYRPCNNYTEYKGHKPFCRKIEQIIYDRENMVRVIRKCGWEKHPRLDCYSMSNKDHVETVCQCFHDGCNSAPITAAGAASFLAVGAVYLLGVH